MPKQNLFAKKLKKHFLSINDAIENYFNKLKFIKSNLKKTKITDNYRVFFVLLGCVILVMSYFSIPSFYDKELIQSSIKNHAIKKYNINLRFNDKIKYSLLPKPHFVSNDLSIIRNKNEIANAKDVKIFISIKDFLSSDGLIFKNIIFKKTDFNFYEEDYNFFKKLLNTEPNENKIIINDSNIFFRDLNDEVLFINKIYKSEFFWDPNNLQNVLISKNEIFNLPYKLIIKNDRYNKKVISNFISKKIRLNIKNETDYNDLEKKGFIDILFVNKGTSLEYKINKDTLKFSSFEKKNSYNGLVEFKPFYLNTNFNYDGINTKSIFNDESLFVDLIKSQILNNSNLSANLTFKVSDITNIDELNNLILKINIEEGDIIFSNSSIKWKDDLEIKLSESILNNSDDEIELVGRLNLFFKDIDNFYRYFQLQKNSRKNIKEIQIDYVYNFDQNQINFDNIKIDNTQNSELENFIDVFNRSGEKIFNRITFKNFVNNFFNSYSG